jgi:O-antigen ligase
LAIQLTDPGWWDRMATTFTHTDASATARVMYWRAAVAMSVDHPFGIGIGNFQEVVKEYVPGLVVVRSAHSTYFECLAELGYPGLALLILVLLTTLSSLSRLRRAAERLEPELPIDIGRWQARFHLGWHAMALRTALVGYLTAAAFTTRLFGENLWILIALAASLENVRAHIEHRARETSRPDACAVEPPLRDALPNPAGGPGYWRTTAAWSVSSPISRSPDQRRN